MAPEGLALLLVAMSFGSHFGQPVPIAMHPPIGQVMSYQPMCGKWHGLAKKAAKNNSSGQVFCAMVGATSVCFVVVLWLLYDAQDVEYTTPTSPKPSETSAEILGDPYSKKAPLPSVRPTSRDVSTSPHLAFSPKDLSYRLLGQSKPQHRHNIHNNHTRILAQ